MIIILKYKVTKLKTLFALSGLLLFTAATFAQDNLQALVKPGTKLIYAVQANEQRYDFIVTVTKLTPAVEFDWEMTESASGKGSIIHTPEAMLTGNTMYNYFPPGIKKLDDQTLSVWLSKSTFSALKKEGKGAMMKMNTDDHLKKMGTYSEEESELQVIIDGEKETIEEELVAELNVEGAPVAKEEIFFSFFDSAKLPINLRMRNGFYIALKEVKTKQP